MGACLHNNAADGVVAKYALYLFNDVALGDDRPLPMKRKAQRGNIPRCIRYSRRDYLPSNVLGLYLVNLRFSLLRLGLVSPMTWIS